MLGPIAMIFAMNSLMMAISRASAWLTVAATVDRLWPRFADWLATLVPSAIAAVVAAPAADPATPCHTLASCETPCASGSAADSNACAIPWNICVGSAPLLN